MWPADTQCYQQLAFVKDYYNGYYYWCECEPGLHARPGGAAACARVCPPAPCTCASVHVCPPQSVDSLPLSPPPPCSLFARNGVKVGSAITNKLVSYAPYSSFTIGQDAANPGDASQL